MAKIALTLEQALAQRASSGAAASQSARLLAQGDGWTVEDVVCTAGPRDRPFQERHSWYRIAIVLSGTFQYRSGLGRELLTPGSLLLGNPCQCFECGHEHGSGDRCLSFGYAPDFFERLGAGTPGFRRLCLPPLRTLSAVVARATATLEQPEALSLQLAVQALQAASDLSPQPNIAAPSAVARVTRSVRLIDHDPSAELTLAVLAREAGLSLYHFLRTFERLTGVTPHKYLQRARLRKAAVALAQEPARILEVALDSGFRDITAFNRAFRSEFGVSPRIYRAQTRTR